MNKGNTVVGVVGMLALLVTVNVASAMTIKDDSMMKKDDAMMSSTSDAMMKKDDESMMKKDDVMMKKDAMTTDAMMKKDDAMMAAPSSDLSVGSRGEGVVALQTFLVAKNLLVMPAGVSMGYFGPLTKAALMSYQASAGVPSTGYYGPLSRAAMGSMMMKKDDAMTSDSMMKKDDAMMSSTSDAMMKKDDAMMKKGQ
jgi:Putative peptidoglycan binding domain